MQDYTPPEVRVRRVYVLKPTMNLLRLQFSAPRPPDSVLRLLEHFPYELETLCSNDMQQSAEMGIDRAQVMAACGGTFQYNHVQWVEQRAVILIFTRHILVMHIYN